MLLHNRFFLPQFLAEPAFLSLNSSYDETTSTLEVVFNSGKTYLYSEVPNNVYLELMDSDSKGSYMRDCVIDCYPYQQVKKRRR
ncbi:KTSC domain-containing protein [Microcoleus sp. BROC3]|uniref:KTSC domain-containing protein n=1 Tax=Microcoleus sp. BROC3 TaxID=3055323 RepID=UPI002FD1EDE1